MSRTARVALNGLSSYGRGIISITVMFFLTPALIQGAGQEDFGLWSLTFAILGVLGLLDMAGMAGVVKWVAECKGSGDVARRNRMLSTVAGLYLAISILALVAVSLFALFYHRLFSIPLHLRDKAQALLWILAVRQVILAVPLLLFKGILFGEQRIVLVNTVETIAFVVYGVIGIAILHAGWGIVALAWVNLGTMLLEYSAYLVLSFVCVPDLRLSRKLADRSLLREVMTFSAAQLVINVASLIRMRTDLIMVRFFVSLAAVPIYTIALRMTEAVYLLVKQFLNVLAPVHAQLAAEGDGKSEALRAMLIHVAKFALMPLVMATAAGFIVGRATIVFWVGPELADASPLFDILLISLVIGGPPFLASTLLGMTGHHHETARAAAFSIVINLAASIVLVLPLGMRGIALGTVISTALVDVGIVLRRACELHEISMFEQFRRVFWPALVPGFAQAAVTYGLVQLWPPSGLASVGLLVLPGVAVYLTWFWFLSTEPIERDVVLQLWRRRRPPS